MEFATGAMGRLLPKLGELLKEEYNLQRSVKHGIKDLTSELEHMHVALVKVSSVPLDQLDPQVKIWASEVREMSYAIEDSLDSSIVRIKSFEPTRPHTFMGFLNKTMNEITMLKARHEMASDIKDIMVQVRKVKERYDRYRIHDVISQFPTVIDPRLSALYKKVSDLVGIDKAIDELMKMLSESLDMSKKRLNAVSVVGFGGLGKTTLVKALYDKLKKRFDCWSFVPVGQNPDTKKVLRDILHELDQQKYTNITSSQMDVRQLTDELKGFLRKKRYLIVIDDIWDISTWETVKHALEDSMPESRIIVTTRICEVAEQVGGIYNMKPLSEDKSKELLYTRLWGGNGTSPDDQSTQVFTTILRKCGDVPLSIITIASLFVDKRPEDWPKLYDSIGFGHEDNQSIKNTRKILSFSYYDLPSCLKNCLLHLSIFPEDHYINKGQLIWIWIAEGFIPCEQGLRLYDIGESYFNQLANRNMIQLVQEGTSTTTYEGCRVHDMVLDLIRNLSGELNFVTVHDNDKGLHTYTPSKSITIRRLAIHGGSTEQHPIHIEMGHVKSLNATLCTDTRLLQLLSFKVLRVLILEECNFSGSACRLEHLGKLVQLRYLGLVNTRIVELPVEIGHDLKFLQTLDVWGSRMEVLPPSVGDMTKLMCLRTLCDTSVMFKIGKLTSLEHLELYSVDECPNFVTDLGKLTEMRVLAIHFNKMHEGVNTALVQSLGNLCRIQILNVMSVMEEYTDDGAWEGWAPPLQLRELSLFGICLPRRPLWMDSPCIPHLCHLWFKVEVAEENDLRILGRLPALRYLNLKISHNLKYTIGSDEFQNLRHLETSARIRFSIGGGALPMLETLVCFMDVGEQDVGGLVPGNMPLLQNARYRIDCRGCSRQEVEVTELALRHAAAEVHPNSPDMFTERHYYESNDDDDDDNHDDDEVAFTGDEEQDCMYDDDEDEDCDEDILANDHELLNLMSTTPPHYRHLFKKSSKTSSQMCGHTHDENFQFILHVRDEDGRPDE